MRSETDVNTGKCIGHHLRTMTNPVLTPALRSRADQDEILDAFAARLREHPILNTATVVVSDQPIPALMPSGGYLITVAPGAGEFPHDLWANGHHNTATEDGSVIVGIFTQSLKDRPGRKEAALTSRAPGKPSLMAWKRAVLKILCVSDEQVTAGLSKQAWEPWDTATGRPFLRDIPQPVRSTAVLDVPEHKGWIGLEITFSCTWDWDLYRA